MSVRERSGTSRLDDVWDGIVMDDDDIDTTLPDEPASTGAGTSSTASSKDDAAGTDPVDDAEDTTRDSRGRSEAGERTPADGQTRAVMARARTRRVVGSFRWIRGLPGRTLGSLRRAADRRPHRVLAVASVAATLLAVLAGGSLWWWQSTMAAQAGREEARQAAISTVPTLLSYGPQSVGSLLATVGPGLTDAFRRDYGTLISQVVAPAAKNQQITTRTEVKGSSVVVETSDSDHATVLMFIDQSTQTAAAPAPASTGSRVRVALDRVDGRWLVSDVKPI